MKRFTLILALVLMITMPTFAERVTSETARKVASTFLSNNGAKSAQLTDLSKEAGFPNLYIFNAEQGFVVMSADDCVKPILGYSLTGRFVAKDMPENIRGWLQGYSDEIQYAIDNEIKADSETAKVWKDLLNAKPNAAKATAVVDALVQTTWDQEGTYYYYGGQYHLVELYNNMCPVYYGSRTVTGCVATAMAQIMKYWEYPATGIGYHSYTPESLPSLGEQFADFGATTYDWNNMPNQLDINSTDAQKNAVATLMYHCGVSVDMDYNTSSSGGSGAVSRSIVPALYNYFGYQLSQYKEKDNYNADTWSDMLKAELDAERPIQYNGYGSGGHAFICDGYNNSNQFHFNWGWSGQNDGFFSLTSLNPGGGGAGGGNYNFTNDQSAIFGIQPSGCTLDAPANFSHTIEGIQNVTLTWDAVSGATSYNVYRDFNLVSNTTSTTLTEIAPFGINTYWVRCVDSNNEMSLASEYEIVNIDYQTPIVNDLAASYSENSVSLSWTAPDWCYPETPSNTLTYGNQAVSSYFFEWNEPIYWGHRHLSNSLSAYDGMKLYSVDFYVNNAGTYELCIFEGAPNASKPSTLVSTQTTVVSATGWSSIDLPNPYTIDKTKDLWVFIHYPETIEGLRAFLCTASGSNGCSYASNPLSSASNYSGYAFLVKAYLTDGTYTYNLYQDGTRIAQGLSQTTYNTTLNNNATNLFTVKTNYYGGETDDSNKIGFTKGTASLTTLALDAADKMTVTEGSKLTVSGTLSDVNTTNLVLENDAQLIHNSSNVQATVKRDIAAYTTNTNNWNLIASPVTENVTPNTENGLLSGFYDLYYYDEPTHYWMNYRHATFNLAHQQGYLYANNANTTLQFAGTLTPSNSSVTLSDLSHSATVLNGFNLVGNPFACNATVDKSFYVTDETGSNIVLADNGRQVKPCEGIFVQATNSNTSVTFTKAGTKSKSLSSSFDLTLTQGRTTIDRTRVHLDNIESLEKFSLNDNTSSQIYFTQNGKNFAVTYANGQNELPLNFKTSQNGIYNLNIEAENLDLDYLHLIDNLTGNDIDLLTTSSYTFEAKTSDYASRFRLVFSNCEDAVGDNATFAYVNNGNIVINQKGTLQIVDMTGRMIIYQGDAKHCVSTNGMASGVYVLRLITTDDTKTQKIIVK